MKKRIAVGVVGTIAVLGLAYIPASPMEPGFEKPKVEEDSPVWDCSTMGNKICGLAETNAQTDAGQFLAGMQEFCFRSNAGAETWVEKLPSGEYEVLGRCTKTFRSGS